MTSMFGNLRKPLYGIFLESHKQKHTKLARLEQYEYINIPVSMSSIRVLISKQDNSVSFNVFNYVNVFVHACVLL